MIGPIFKLIRALQSNTNPAEIAFGAVLGLYFGLTPLNHTHVIFLVLAFFFLKINRAATILILPLVKLIYVIGLVHVADQVGLWLLETLPDGFWSQFTHAPVLALFDFEYSLVIGGFLMATILAIPVYILVVRLVLAYRSGLKEKLDQWKITRWIKGLSITKWIVTWWPKN